MTCLCVQESFTDYFAEQAEVLQAQLKEFPAVLTDLWADVSSLTNAEVETEVLGALTSGIMASGALDALIDQVTAVVKANATGAVPRLDDALAELRGVKTTQDALKALAAIVFILYKDSIFHLLQGLALEIVRTATAKQALLARLDTLMVMIERGVTLFESSPAGTDEIRELVNESADLVNQARALAETSRKRAASGTEIRRPAVDRICDLLNQAQEILNPETIDSSVLNSFNAAIVVTEAAAGASSMAAALVIGAQVAEVRSTADQLATNSRKLNSLLSKFRGSVRQYQASTFESYQAKLLTKVVARLGRVHGEMVVVGNNGTPLELATSVPSWLIEIASVKELMLQMPPEVREAVLDSTSLAAFDLAVARLESMNAIDVVKADENITTLTQGSRRAIEIAEAALSELQVQPIAVNVRWLVIDSDEGILPVLDFIEALDEDGVTPRFWRSSEDNLLKSSFISSGVSAPPRLQTSRTHAALVVNIMEQFLETKPPGNEAVTVLLNILKTLGMDKASDLLQEGGINEFMSSGPFAWTYAGAAAECIQKAMEDALDKGQDRVFDDLDTVLSGLTAKVASIQRGMQRGSVLALDNLLAKVEEQIQAGEDLKDQVFSLVTGLDC